MATACLRSTLVFTKTFRISDAVLHIPQPAINRTALVFCQILPVRHGSFFNKKSAEAAWDSMITVSNAGRKRGRASRGKLLKKVNLSVGQKMGHGKTGLIFPGLSSNITGKEKLSDLGIRRLEKESESETTSDALRIQKGKRMVKTSPLDRGYTGRSIAGQKVEPPDPVGGYDFSDFEAYILETKLVGHVTANQGKVYNSSALVAVGNGKGLIGLSVGKASSTMAAIVSAKNKAAQRLMFVNMYKDHTVSHNFTEKFHSTSVIVKQAPKGEGLHCHRTLKILCRLIGIKDIYVKAEGQVGNYHSLCRAFIYGLVKTKSHQEIADELGHHVVEYRAEKDYYPVVVASPSENVKRTDFKKPDGFSFDTYCFGNKLPLNKPPSRPFYWRSKGFKKKQFHNYRRRNQARARIDRMVQGFQTDFNTRRLRQ